MIADNHTLEENTGGETFAFSGQEFDNLKKLNSYYPVSFVKVYAKGIGRAFYQGERAAIPIYTAEYLEPSSYRTVYFGRLANRLYIQLLSPGRENRSTILDENEVKRILKSILRVLIKLQIEKGLLLEDIRLSEGDVMLKMDSTGFNPQKINIIFTAARSLRKGTLEELKNYLRKYQAFSRILSGRSLTLEMFSVFGEEMINEVVETEQAAASSAIASEAQEEDIEKRINEYFINLKKRETRRVQEVLKAIEVIEKRAGIERMSEAGRLAIIRTYLNNNKRAVSPDSIVPRPLTDTFIDKEKAEEWVKAQPEEFRGLAKFLIEHIRYIDQNEFELNLEASARQFNRKIKNRPYVILQGSTSLYKKSDIWVRDLLVEKGMLGVNAAGIVNAKKPEQFINEGAAEINDILVIDDIAFTGKQTVDIIRKFKGCLSDNFNLDKVTFHILVPFMMRAAEERIREECPCVKLYKQQRIPTAEEIVKRYGDNRIYKLFRKIFFGGGKITKALTYAAHKIANQESVLGPVFSGMVIVDIEKQPFFPDSEKVLQDPFWSEKIRYIPFIPPIIPPYRTAYSSPKFPDSSNTGNFNNYASSSSISNDGESETISRRRFIRDLAAAAGGLIIWGLRSSSDNAFALPTLRKFGLKDLPLYLRRKVFTYRIKKGDTIYSLCRQFNMSEVLFEDLNGSGLLAGDTVKIISVDYSIFVDRSENRLYVLTGDDAGFVLLYSCPVATGRRGRRTPLREFKIREKIFRKPSWRDCDHPSRIYYYGQRGYPYGKLGIWMQIDKYGHYAMHTTSAPWSIGRYASHGCIRMRDKDAIWIYKIVPLGTLVKVMKRGMSETSSSYKLILGHPHKKLFRRD